MNSVRRAKSFRILQLFVLVTLVLTFIGAAVPAQAQTFSVVYNFGSNPNDPANPRGADAIAQGRDVDLYSTSVNGGSIGHGTAFKITPTGTVTVLASFDTTTSFTYSGLTLGTDGNYYGSSTDGGTSGYGTIYKISSGGTYTLLHAFTGGSDGGNPEVPPMQASTGSYYGTTSGLGVVNSTVYKATSAGVLTTLHTFSGTDGSYVEAGLVQGTDGNLYGCSNFGGTANAGVIYKITTAGKLTVLHDFTGTDGSECAFAPIQVSDGNLDGTTVIGGTSGNGVIFRITTGGAYTVLHNFNGTSDGQHGSSSLVQASDGNLYGVTLQAGSPGFGTIYKITTGGKYSVLHNFIGTDGEMSESPLIQRTDGILYSDNYQGGSHGLGVFYSLNIGAKPFLRLALTSGKAGTLVGMFGQGFDSASVVKFGGVAATSITLTGSTYIVATVPAGAVDGYVTVTTGSTTLTSTQTFTVHNSWSIGKVMPTARFGAFTGAIGANIYVVGGATNSGYQVTNVNEIYNTQTNTWKTGAPLPTARELGASAVVNGILYVLGGSTSGSNPQNVVVAYNPVSNTWTTKAPMPTARNSMPAVVDKNVIYVIGGYDPNTQVFYDTVESYNTTTDTWTEEKPLPVATAWEAVGLLGTTIVSADGQISPGTVSGTRECYNPNTNTWTGLTADPTPRLEPCFAAITGQLYVAGGANTTGGLRVNDTHTATPQ